MLDQLDTWCQVDLTDFVSSTWHNVAMDPESVVKARIARALSQWIAARKLTKSGLADQTGIARQTIDDILNEKRLAETPTLIKLAGFFEIMPGALVDGDKPPGATAPKPPANADETGSRSKLRVEFDQTVLAQIEALEMAVTLLAGESAVSASTRLAIESLIKVRKAG